MLALALRDLWRRPLRTGLTVSGLALAVAVLGSLSAFGGGYRRSLGLELDRMGIQMMLVPLGCPYDAAAQVLKGRGLENSLPESTLEAARRDPAVAVAAPLLMAAVPRPDQGRTDLWVGLDRAALALKPWWKAREGSAWFTRPNGVILGSEAAAVELRGPGDRFYSPETGRAFTVEGVLERSGTSDDSLFFVPLAAAQGMFDQAGRLTAVALRLKDPSLTGEASERLQQVPGAQVVTMTEMMGTFLNLVGAVRTLLTGVALVALAAGVLTVFNTLLGSVLEQTPELAVMRALGASRGQVFGLVALEGLLLTGAGTLLGLALTVVLGGACEALVRQWIPFPPSGSLVALDLRVGLHCVGVALGTGLIAGLYPAWQASRLQPALAVRGA